jgi:hypothetical protein
MNALRNAHFFARLVLVWFALSLGVAIASPLVKPQTMELICSGAGMMKLVLPTDDGSTPAPSATLDCPLCATGNAPPPPIVNLVAQPAQPLAYALQSIPAARIAALTAAPLPARGPPASTPVFA